MPQKNIIRHFHVSGKSAKCIDIYLDDGKETVYIVDTFNEDNRITISGDDWNKFIDEVKIGVIGKIRKKA